MSDNKSSEMKVAWVKLGKVWWPGKLVNEADHTDEMKRDINESKARKSSVKADQIHVVEFFDEPGFEIINNPAQILLNVDEEKKFDLVKRAVSTMKSSALADNRVKFEKDVLHVEKLVNPSADLTSLTRLLRGEPLEPKKQTGVNKYADIFPTAKPEKPSPAAATPGRGGRQASVKFNFPSSRIISTASSKPASKISPLPSNPAKKYHCVNCSFSADRVNIITTHMKHCRQGKQQQQKRGSVGSTTSSPVPVPPSSASPVTTPTKATKTAPSPPPVALATALESPVKKTPGRKSTRGKAKAATVAEASTPAATSAAAVVTTTPKSVPASTRQKAKTTPVNAGSAAPKKRGRRGKKDKQISDKQKSEILQDWNDSSSEENDSDDELAPLMPPTKPPELFLFGSEKNKKRKAGVSTPDAASLGGEEKNGEGAADGKAETESAAGNEDQPPVLKKPRTDKELSDAFEALLKNTKPDYEKLLDKAEKGETDKQDEEEEMVVEEEEETNHLSDIEEDANIVMKKAETNANIVVKKTEEDANTEMKKGDTANDKEENAQTKEVEKELDENTKQVEEIIKEPEVRTPSTRGRRAAAAAAAAAQSAKSATRKMASPPPVTKQPTPAKSTALAQTKKPVEEKKGVKAVAATTVTPSVKAVVTNKVASPPPVTKQSEPTPTPPVTKQPAPVSTAPVTKEPELVPTAPVAKQPEPVPTAPATKQAEPVPTTPVTKEPELVPTAPVTKQAEPVPTAPVTKEPEPVSTATVTKEPEPVPTPIPTKSVTPTVQTKKPVIETKEVTAAAVTIPPPAPTIQSVKVETNKVTPASPVTSAPTIQSAKVETNKVAPPSPVKKQAEPVPTLSPTKSIKSVTPTVQTKKSEEEKKEVTVSAATIPPPPLVAATPATATVQSTKTVTNKVAPLPPVTKQSEPVPVPTPVSVPTKPITPTVQTKKSEEEKKEVTATAATIPPPPLIAATPATTTAIVQSTKAAANKVAPPPPVTKQAEPVPITSPKKSVQIKKSVEEKKEVAAVAATITTIPPPPLIAAAPATTTVAASRATPSPQVVQKKPTAAVRPLVDTKEVAKEPVAPTPVKDVKGTGSSVPPPKSSPSKDQPQPPQQPPGIPSGTQQQVETEDPSGKKSPALVAQRVVHLVPVENADGSITYMLLSLENGTDNPSVVLESGTESGDTILRLDKVEAMEQGGPPNNPMNATEVEGIFLDKNVDNANQIVSALTAAATGASGTVPTSMMDTTTAYVTLALDPTSAATMGVVASGSETTSTTVAGQPQTIVIPEGAAAIAQEGGAEAVSQQVFYMTEDGAILDPQSLGLTYEQLQQLLNQ